MFEAAGTIRSDLIITILHDSSIFESLMLLNSNDAENSN